MSRIFHFLRSLVKSSSTATAQVTKKTVENEVFRDFARFAEGDRLLINGQKISAPLRKNLVDRDIPHDDVIGQSASIPLFLRTKAGVQKLEYPSFEQYIALTRRVVTPIYASYASFLVSLLDLHVHASPTSGSTSRLPDDVVEILDAGTGHGSVTVHLAKAIAGATPPPPALEFPGVPPLPSRFVSQPPLAPQDARLSNAWSEWRSLRRAVIHTVEPIAATSRHADKLIRAYRQGLYWPHIDFHLAMVEDWIEEQMRIRGTEHCQKSHSIATPASKENEFLSHAVLDMPAVHERLSVVSSALRTGGTIVAFAPSITQIGDCVRTIHKLGLPLHMENTIELGEGLTNGRKWDVRLVTPRNQRNISQEVVIKPQPDKGDEDSEIATESDDAAIDDRLDVMQTQPVMICRPKVGETIQGGGFIGVWKKVSKQSDSLEAEWLRSTGKGKRKKRS